MNNNYAEVAAVHLPIGERVAALETKAANVEKSLDGIDKKLDRIVYGVIAVLLAVAGHLIQIAMVGRG